MSKRPAKRQKTTREFGAPTAEDDPSRTAENNPSSSALSTREPFLDSLPSLSTICARVFVRNFRRLADEESGNWEVTRNELAELPDAIAVKLFSMLKAKFPHLSHAIIATYFMRGDSLQLDGSMSITLETLSAIPRLMGSNLESLVITDVSKFSDKAFASTLKRLPSLRVINLRNCSKVAALTVEAVATTCRHLRSINLSNTGVNAAALLPLVRNCLTLEVLKVAGLQNITDATISRLLLTVAGPADDPDDVPLITRMMLKNLRSLKLRYNMVTEASISSLTEHCTKLERLDLSFTRLKHVPHIEEPSSIVKLSLTSTFISGTELVDLVRRTPKLRILNIGSMGVKAGTSSSAAMGSAAMSLNDDVLVQLTDALLDCSDIESINLVQNAKLGALVTRRDTALSYFIKLVGRKCKSLNLAGIPGLRSSDLNGLVPENDMEPVSPLRTLILNKTNIDDNASPWICACLNLETLEVAETKISPEGLFPILDACYRLSELNLTGCRSVKVGDRRRFFEVKAYDNFRSKST
ncbi:RNI-like protein [Schizopora paradoxa]|uniref:RNI-like protein n=1 Tax=Schizopora paradoxa TaxID=27342 RepID=A0A0H2S8M3_9AGAM|nr:RNI-like protein [Schizopora paradoxa]